MPYNRKLTKRKTIPKKRVYRRRKVTKVIKSYVNQAIHKQIENKTIQYNSGFTMVNYTDDNFMRGFALSPGTSLAIPQGTGEGDRTGNRIKIMKATLTYWLVPAAYSGLLNPNPKPTNIRIWIGYSKTNPTIIPPAADTAVFFQNGDTSQPPNGFISDILRSVNKDKYVIFRDIKHKLGYASASGTGFVAGSEYFANNDFKYNIMKKIDITKYLIRNVIYNDGTAIPTTRGLFCWCQVVYADNTTTTGTIPANFNYFVDLTYEDA